MEMAGLPHPQAGSSPAFISTCWVRVRYKKLQVKGCWPGPLHFPGGSLPLAKVRRLQGPPWRVAVL